MLRRGFVDRQVARPGKQPEHGRIRQRVPLKYPDGNGEEVDHCRDACGTEECEPNCTSQPPRPCLLSPEAFGIKPPRSKSQERSAEDKPQPSKAVDWRPDTWGILHESSHTRF